MEQDEIHGIESQFVIGHVGKYESGHLRPPSRLSQADMIVKSRLLEWDGRTEVTWGLLVQLMQLIVERIKAIRYATEFFAETFADSELERNNQNHADSLVAMPIILEFQDPSDGDKVTLKLRNLVGQLLGEPVLTMHDPQSGELLMSP